MKYTRQELQRAPAELALSAYGARVDDAVQQLYGVTWQDLGWEVDWIFTAYRDGESAFDLVTRLGNKYDLDPVSTW